MRQCAICVFDPTNSVDAHIFLEAVVVHQSREFNVLNRGEYRVKGEKKKLRRQMLP